MPQTKDHIVKSFDEEIRKLNNYITHMGGLAETQLQAAVQALVKRDADSASRIIQDDAKIDEQEHLISQQVVRLLALRQPMAVDLRQIVAALKISSDLERFGVTHLLVDSTYADPQLLGVTTPPLWQVGSINLYESTAVAAARSAA